MADKINLNDSQADAHESEIQRLNGASNDQYDSDKSGASNSEIPLIESKNDENGNEFAITPKRSDYIVWWDYFMSIAYITAMRSKDPNTQVGACIVNESNRIVSLGYNGMPNGCSDDELPWNRTAASLLDTKYAYVCHAEMNAILNKTSYDLSRCTLFVLLFPCNECAKMIIQAGIACVVYLSDKYHREERFQASKRLLTMAGVRLCQYTPTRRQILIDFDQISQ